MSRSRAQDPMFTQTLMQEAVERRDFHAALGCALELYAPGLRSLGRSAGLCDEEIEDRLHDAVLRAASRSPAFCGDGFVPWLFTIVRYEMLSGRKSVIRRSRRDPAHVPLAARSPTADEELEAADTAAAVAALKAGLDPVNARIIEAFDEDLTDEALALEIATTLGFPITAHAICGRRFRLRTAIATALARQGEP